MNLRMNQLSPEFQHYFGLGFFTMILFILTVVYAFVKYCFEWNPPILNILDRYIWADNYRPIQPKKPFKILHREPFEMKMISPIHIDF